VVVKGQRQEDLEMGFHLFLKEVVGGDTTVAWFLAICLVHVVLLSAFRSRGPFQSKPWLATHQLSSLVGLIYCSAAGIAHMWSNEDSHLFTNSIDRLYKFNMAGQDIAKVQLAFQFFNFLVTLFESELANRPVMLVHHAVTASLAWFGTYHATYLHYYSLFYYGLSEISSIPLVFVELFRYFPGFAEKNRIADIGCKAIFFFCFIYFRLVLWSIVNFSFWKDTLSTLADQKSHCPAVAVYFLAANLILSGLQFYWGWILIKEAFNLVTSAPSDYSTSTKVLVEQSPSQSHRHHVKAH